MQSIGLSEIHINNRAMTKGYGNDIALLKLSRPALIGGRVGLACLPSGDLTDRVAPGTKCFLTGTSMLFNPIQTGGGADSARKNFGRL